MKSYVSSTKFHVVLNFFQKSTKNYNLFLIFLSLKIFHGERETT